MYIYIFTVSFSLLPVLFRRQQHSFSSYLDFVFSGQKHHRRVLNTRGITCKNLAKDIIKEKPKSTALTLLTCLAETSRTQAPIMGQRSTGTICNIVSRNMGCLAHHSRIHSLCFHPQCKAGKTEGKQQTCDVRCPRIGPPHS